MRSASSDLKYEICGFLRLIEKLDGTRKLGLGVSFRPDFF